MSDVWFRTTDLWNSKRPLYQLDHNHYQLGRCLFSIGSPKQNRTHADRLVKQIIHSTRFQAIVLAITLLTSRATFAASFPIIFCLFQSNSAIFQNKIMRKCLSSIQRWDTNSRRHVCESLSLAQDQVFRPTPQRLLQGYGAIRVPLIFKKMGQSRPLFVYFRSFLIIISIQIEKSIDGVLGIRAQGRRMVGADETTELWGPPVPLFLN